MPDLPASLPASRPASRARLRTLYLSVAGRDVLIAHARADFPAEACGIIGGSQRDGMQQASCVIQLPNSAAVATVRYTIEPRAFLAAYRRIESAGHELIAIYHSHPHGDPIPSATDLAEASWPEAAYLIVGLRDFDSPQIAAWQIRRGQATPIAIQLATAVYS